MQRNKSAVDNLKGVYILHCWTFVGNFDQKLDKVRYKVIELQILKVYRFWANHKYIVNIYTNLYFYKWNRICAEICLT